MLPSVSKACPVIRQLLCNFSDPCDRPVNAYSQRYISEDARDEEDGFVSKSESSSELLKAIYEVVGWNEDSSV